MKLVRSKYHFELLNITKCILFYDSLPRKTVRDRALTSNYLKFCTIVSLIYQKSTVPCFMCISLDYETQQFQRKPDVSILLYNFVRAVIICLISRTCNCNGNLNNRNLGIKEVHINFFGLWKSDFTFVRLLQLKISIIKLVTLIKPWNLSKM